jgi:Flp pilus assembly protein TadD
VSQTLAARALRDGRDFYQARDYDRAIHAIQTAIRLDPENAELHFILAIIQYQQGRRREATQSVAAAVALEEQQPLPNWGRSMQRYQGAARVWLEETRRQLHIQH